MTKLEFYSETFKGLFEREFNTNETIELLQRFNLNVYFSWGVDTILHIPDKGLLLNVNAHHHQGLVLVTLGWNDTYTYYLINPDFSVKKKATDVYFDELQYRIDQDIEYIDDYKF
jgi:hypothetical protein